MKAEEIVGRIKSGHVLWVRTSMKMWKITPKTLDKWERSGHKLFRDGKAGEQGFYMARGSHWDYVDPRTVAVDFIPASKSEMVKEAKMNKKMVAAELVRIAEELSSGIGLMESVPLSYQEQEAFNHSVWVELKKRYGKYGNVSSRLGEARIESLGNMGGSAVVLITAQMKVFNVKVDVYQNSLPDFDMRGIVSGEKNFDKLDKSVVVWILAMLDKGRRVVALREEPRSLSRSRVEALARIAEDLIIEDPMAKERIGHMLMELHGWTTKKLMTLPSSAPIGVQLMESLNSVEEKLRGKGNLTGKEAVEAMLEAMSGLYTVDASPIRRLWRKYDEVDHMFHTYGFR